MAFAEAEMDCIAKKTRPDRQAGFLRSISCEFWKIRHLYFLEGP